MTLESQFTIRNVILGFKNMLILQNLKNIINLSNYIEPPFIILLFILMVSFLTSLSIPIFIPL